MKENRMDQSDQIRLNRPKWTKENRNGPNKTKEDRNGPQWTELDRIGPKCTKWTKEGYLASSTPINYDILIKGRKTILQMS